MRILLGMLLGVLVGVLVEMALGMLLEILLGTLLGILLGTLLGPQILGLACLACLALAWPGPAWPCLGLALATAKTTTAARSAAPPAEGGRVVVFAVAKARPSQGKAKPGQARPRQAKQAKSLASKIWRLFGQHWLMFRNLLSTQPRFYTYQQVHRDALDIFRPG